MKLCSSCAVGCCAVCTRPLTCGCEVEGHRVPVKAKKQRHVQVLQLDRFGDDY